MWEKQFSVLAPTHVTVINSNENLHFFVSGDNEKLVNEVASALVDNLNLKKKNKILRIKERIGEVCILESGCRLGCVGKPKKTDAENRERAEFLKQTISNF